MEAEYGIKWELLFKWYRRVATSKLTQDAQHTTCRKPPRYVPYKCTYVPYDGTFGASDQGQMLDV